MSAPDSAPCRAAPVALPARRIPRLLAISDLAGMDGKRLDDWLGALAEAGVDALQVRAKSLSDRELFGLVRRARRVLPARVAVLVNARADVALAAGADGVHLPTAGLPVEALRRLAAAAERTLLVGRSTHHPEEVRAARAEGVDYVIFGPVYPTPSKERYGPPPGLPGLRAAAREGVPVLALGGVGPGCLAELAAAGAAGAAGIRAFSDPGRARQMAREARAVWGAAERPPVAGW